MCCWHQAKRLPAAHGRDGGVIGPAGAFLDLDYPDDFGHGYLAQTIFRTVSATEPGDVLNHLRFPSALSRVAPLVIFDESAIFAADQRLDFIIT